MDKQLTHIENKALRIIVNQSNFGKLKLPKLSSYIRLLSLRMNRTEDEVKEVLKTLEEKEYIRVRDNQIEFRG